MTAATSGSGLSPNTQGALWMLLSAVTFSAMATLIKFLGDDYPAALQTFYRQAAGVVILLPVILRHRGAAFATTRPGILIFRASAGTVGVILSFYAFQNMPLAIFVVKEKVGALRIGAAVVGFLGVLVMVRPGVGGAFAVGVPALAMLASSFLFALTVTGMKVLTRDHSTTVILVWSALLGLAFSLPGAILTWRVPEPVDLVLLCAMGAIGVVNQACYIKGMSLGDAAAMAPIDYTRLIFTAAIGLFLFSEVPTVWTIAGALVVAGSTLFITVREQRLARSAKLSAEANAG